MFFIQGTTNHNQRIQFYLEGRQQIAESFFSIAITRKTVKLILFKSAHTVDCVY